MLGIIGHIDSIAGQNLSSLQENEMFYSILIVQLFLFFCLHANEINPTLLYYLLTSFSEKQTLATWLVSHLS